MAISFVRVQATTATSNGKTATPTMQSGANAPVDGNLLLAFFNNNKGSTESYSTVPAGWTNQVAPFNNGTTSSEEQGRLDYRFAASDSGVAYQWALSGFCEFISAVLEYSGVDSTTPFDVAVVTDNTNAQSLSGITTVTNGCKLVYAALYDSSTNTITASDQAGWTGRVADQFSGGTIATMYVADTDQASAGASGTVGPTWSGTGPTKIISVLAALRPAATSAPPFIPRIVIPRSAVVRASRW